jgi:diguanylate cyclase (GGDEF)-like protein
MISIKRYLELAKNHEQPHIESSEPGERPPQALLPLTVAAYRSALVEMGNCGLDACPALGEELSKGLGKLGEKLDGEVTAQLVGETASGVRKQLESWGRRTALHYREKTGEVREMLLSMARTAESVGQRDERCASQIAEVTTRLKKIANLEDLTEIRASIEQSAVDLKTSIDRMAAEGKVAIAGLRAEVLNYQEKLEKAEQIASRDALTGVWSRLRMEGRIERSLREKAAFSVAIIDIDGFKQVNDEHGHLVGDELLKQFAAELQSACRSTEVIGRWGGDEFILLLDLGLCEAKAQTDRLREWVCGNYTVQGESGPKKLRVEASIGLAERLPKESVKALVDRADAAMYREKAMARMKRNKHRG